MITESLEELAAAFESWRKNRRNVREPVPQALWEQARRALETHGALAVARATKFQRSRLVERIEKTKGAAVPAFSQVSIAAPSALSCPIAEVETAAGLKLRFFVQTEGILELLSSLCVDRSASLCVDRSAS